MKAVGDPAKVRAGDNGFRCAACLRPKIWFAQPLIVKGVRGMQQRDRQFEYNKGLQDALRGHGYNDGAINTQGPLIVFRLTFRQSSSAYSEGYEDGLFYRAYEAGRPLLAIK